VELLSWWQTTAKSNLLSLTLFLLFLRRNKKSNEEVFLLPRYTLFLQGSCCRSKVPFHIFFKILSLRWAGKRRKDESEEYISRPAISSYSLSMRDPGWGL
jgi:hypothetical protein